MRLDVLLGDALPTLADVAGRVVIVVDVLRAATTTVTALANGARAVVPFDGADEPVALAKKYDRSEIRLAGERKMQRIPGFDLGNSPSEYSRDVVEGRTILYTTTNGTPALVASQGAKSCWFAAFVNCTATVAAVRDAISADGDVMIIASGTARKANLEDVVCAGRLARLIARGKSDVTMTDGARMSVFLEKRYGNSLDRLAKDASHAQSLTEAGFGADVTSCLEIDSAPIAVMYHNRQLTKYVKELDPSDGVVTSTANTARAS